MGQVVVINAPYGFSTVWSVIKPWLAKETQEKVDIVGSDFKEVLLDLVDAENLPEMFGGKCTCSEHGGCMKSNAGPWVDGRRERRERWLKGEGSLTEPSPWDEKVLNAESVDQAVTSPSVSTASETTNGVLQQNGEDGGTLPNHK